MGGVRVGRHEGRREGRRQGGVGGGMKGCVKGGVIGRYKGGMRGGVRGVSHHPVPFGVCARVGVGNRAQWAAYVLSPRYGGTTEFEAAEYIFDARVPSDGLGPDYLSGVATSPTGLCTNATYELVEDAGPFEPLTRGANRTSNYTAFM